MFGCYVNPMKPCLAENPFTPMVFLCEIGLNQGSSRFPGTSVACAPIAALFAIMCGSDTQARHVADVLEHGGDCTPLLHALTRLLAVSSVVYRSLRHPSSLKSARKWFDGVNTTNHIGIEELAKSSYVFSDEFDCSATLSTSCVLTNPHHDLQDAQTGVESVAPAALQFEHAMFSLLRFWRTSHCSQDPATAAIVCTIADFHTVAIIFVPSPYRPNQSESWDKSDERLAAGSFLLLDLLPGRTESVVPFLHGFMSSNGVIGYFKSVRHVRLFMQQRFTTRAYDQSSHTRTCVLTLKVVNTASPSYKGNTHA